MVQRDHTQIFQKRQFCRDPLQSRQFRSAFIPYIHCQKRTVLQGYSMAAQQFTGYLHPLTLCSHLLEQTLRGSLKACAAGRSFLPDHFCALVQDSLKILLGNLCFQDIFCRSLSKSPAGV